MSERMRVNLDAGETKVLKAAMEKLDFVQWDRLTITAAYGWIDREQDGYKDFVVLLFDSLFPIERTADLGFVTSSEKYSLEISKRLGMNVDNHAPCSRVEDNFDIKNCIRLENSESSISIP